jgi:hypothetical protein
MSRCKWCHAEDDWDTGRQCNCANVAAAVGRRTKVSARVVVSISAPGVDTSFECDASENDMRFLSKLHGITATTGGHADAVINYKKVL